MLDQCKLSARDFHALNGPSSGRLHAVALGRSLEVKELNRVLASNL
jgi:hypothetical protein